MPFQVQRRTQPPANRRGLALSVYRLAATLAVGTFLLFSACTPDAAQVEDRPPGAPASPLPPCPDTPNCALATRLFEMPPDSLFLSVMQAIQRMEASQVDTDPLTRRVDAVFTVLVFEDDVSVIVLPQTSGSVLHIRSASRTGYSDLGVNRRRIQHFFDTLAAR